MFLIQSVFVYTALLHKHYVIIDNKSVFHLILV